MSDRGAFGAVHRALTAAQIAARLVLGGLSMPDNQWSLYKAADATAKQVHSLAAYTPATTRTVTWQDASGTVPFLGTAQTWSATQTFSASIVQTGANTLVTGTGGVTINGDTSVVGKFLRLSTATNTSKLVLDAAAWGDTKFDSQGVAWNVRTLGTGFIFNGGAAERPEVSWYRGARTYPEFSIREHTTNDTGGEIWAGSGSVAPTLVMAFSASSISITPATSFASTTTQAFTNTSASGIARAALINPTFTPSGAGAQDNRVVEILPTFSGSANNTTGIITLYGRLIVSSTATLSTATNFNALTDVSSATGVITLWNGYTAQVSNSGGGASAIGTGIAFRAAARAGTGVGAWVAFLHGSVPTGFWGYYNNTSDANYLGNGATLISSPTSASVVAFSGTGILPGLQLNATFTAGCTQGIGQWINDTAGPNLILSKSRGGAVGTHAVLTSGDRLGSIIWDASDGTVFQPSVRMYAQADGASSAGAAPGKWFLATTPAGSATPADRLSIDALGQVLALSPLGGLGYGTGAGGTVTQITSKATGVTLNKVVGAITLNVASLAATTSVGFTLTNSAIAAADAVLVSVKSGATADAYTVTVDAVAAGSCRISLRNVTAGALAEAVVLTFAVIKGAIT